MFVLLCYRKYVFWLLLILEIFGQSKIHYFCLNYHISTENQNFLVLSDNQTDADTAIRTCLSLGGKLAEITSQTASNEIKMFLKKNLINSGEKCFIFIIVIYKSGTDSKCIKNHKKNLISNGVLSFLMLNENKL